MDFRNEPSRATDTIASTASALSRRAVFSSIGERRCEGRGQELLIPGLYSFGGERFKVGAVLQRGADNVVMSKIVPAHGDPTSLTCRMRQTVDGWKIIDVYYGAISQLTTRRSDFAGPGPAAGRRACWSTWTP